MWVRQQPAIAGFDSDIGDRKTGVSLLPLLDFDFDDGIRPEIAPVTRIMLRMPVSNASRDLFEKVETALVGQMSETVNQICHDMLVACAAPTLKNRNSLGGPGDVVGFIRHRLPRISSLPAEVVSVSTKRQGKRMRSNSA
jgi:hypothetical protein